MRNSEKKRPRVVLDVGHSEAEKGARSPFDPSVSEWDYNLALAGFIMENAPEIEFKVNLRSPGPGGYRNLPSQIKSLLPDLVISLHCNAAENRSAYGTEMIANLSCVSSVSLAEELQKVVCELFDRDEKGNRGVKTPIDGRGQHLINSIDVPCVICEPFFLSNESDFDCGIRYHEALGVTIANALKRFLK